MGGPPPGDRLQAREAHPVLKSLGTSRRLWPILVRETLEGYTKGEGPCWQIKKFSEEEKTRLAPGCGQGRNPSARTPRTQRKTHQAHTPTK